MSNRTLIEINHDLSHEINSAPESFAEDLMTYLRAASKPNARRLENYGIRVFGVRHHSEPFDIQWGGIDAKS